jgi:hypothetical protein
MNITNKVISTGLVAVATGSALVASPRAAGAASPEFPDSCPVIDTEPTCEIVAPPSNPDSGANVAVGQAVVGLAARTAAAPVPISLGGPLTCSIYDVPAFEYPVSPRSTLMDGLPYVVVCEDSTGNPALSELFVYRLDA